MEDSEIAKEYDILEQMNIYMLLNGLLLLFQ